MATTVVEVGVDIKHADIIVIESSNRYGIAQLHQLRGRVGRSQKQSYCILIYDDNLSYLAKKRLQSLKKNNDGFIIAEDDLILRGPGEVLGTKQSGQNKFKFVDFNFHNYLIDLAKKETERLYNDNTKKKNLQYLLKIFKNDRFHNNLGG